MAQGPSLQIGSVNISTQKQSSTVLFTLANTVVWSTIAKETTSTKWWLACHKVKVDLIIYISISIKCLIVYPTRYCGATLRVMVSPRNSLSPYNDSMTMHMTNHWLRIPLL